MTTGENRKVTELQNVKL